MYASAYVCMSFSEATNGNIGVEMFEEKYSHRCDNKTKLSCVNVELLTTVELNGSKRKRETTTNRRHFGRNDSLSLLYKMM